MRRLPAVLWLLFLSACLATPAPAPTLAPAPALGPAPALDTSSINLDPPTQALIAAADRVAFVVPFSHWDTDWHDTYANYSKRSDGNILAAIQLARQDSRYRYAFEQVLFVQHFWDNYPDQRETLRHFVQNRQFTFAWTGITQPETSLVAPATQVRNLQLGRQWIAGTFGPEFISDTAWQSDAFGNSAAFPIFLAANGIPNLFIGRWQHRCDPDYEDCQPLPGAFYWQSPAAGARVLVSYSSYPSAWDAIHRLPDEDEQVKALAAYVDGQFARTGSKFVFIPMGSDFIDPIPNIVSLVDRWNAAHTRTKVVIADPATAFHYLGTQDLPTLTVDLNPIWQAFYATRPFAKITDKEVDYYLTAADKFIEAARPGLTAAEPSVSAAWDLAAINAHYDNISGVSFDNVWNESQRPRYEQTLQSAGDSLSAALAAIAGGIDAPLIIFNPSSWTRSEVVEIQAPPGTAGLPVGQALDGDRRAILVQAVPGIGWTSRSGDLDNAPAQPASITQSNGLTTLANGLVSVTLDPARGGAITELPISNHPGLIASPSDDLTFWEDTGDVYGATFKSLIARESDTAAQIETLAAGPLLARARITFSLDGQPVAKIVTLRAGSALVEVELTFAITPNTAAVVQTHTDLQTTSRTDDLGFATLTHELDNALLAPGDRTYRRQIFYPITYCADVSDSRGGLALITHGLQGLGGVSDLNLLLTRDARQDEEGVTDTDSHTFHYAYLPHAGPLVNLPQLAYAFNQPLIPVLRSDSRLTVQLPFGAARQFAPSSSAAYPAAYSFLSAESALILDLYRSGDQLYAVVVNYNPAGSPAAITAGDRTIPVPAEPLSIVPIDPN